MTGPGSLLRLLQTTDSAFPSGGFAFSHGLETLSVEGEVRDAAGVEAVLRSQVAPRWLEFDRHFLAAAHAAAGDGDGDGNGAALAALDRDCEVQNTVAALASASRRMGRALLTSHARIGTHGAGEALERVRAGTAHGHAPVVQGLIGAGLGLSRAETEAGAFHALIAGHTGAAIRLGRLGALEAQQVLARAIETFAPRLAEAPPAEPAAFAPLIDIAAARRSAQSVTLFAT